MDEGRLEISNEDIEIDVDNDRKEKKVKSSKTLKTGSVIRKRALNRWRSAS